MADAEESVPVEGAVAERKDEAKAKEKESTPAFAKSEHNQMDPTTTNAGKQKPHKDFWICCGLLVLFGIVCFVGFFVIKVLVFSEGDKAKILDAQRYTGYAGMIDMSKNEKK